MPKLFEEHTPKTIWEKTNLILHNSKDERLSNHLWCYIFCERLHWYIPAEWIQMPKFQWKNWWHYWQLAALLGNSIGKTLLLQDPFIGPYPSLKQQWKISSICKWWTLHCYISSPKVYVRWCIPKAPTDIFTKKVNILHQLQNHPVTIRQRKTLMYQKKHNFHYTKLLDFHQNSFHQWTYDTKLEWRLGWCRIFSIR